MTTNSRISLPFLALAAAFAILVAACAPAESPVACDAPAINVTKIADTSDGMCSTADCSLRETVIRANTCAGAQTIQVLAGAYTLTRAGAGEDAASTGDLDRHGHAHGDGQAGY
jgi:CSLREA domain-containing protein